MARVRFWAATRELAGCRETSADGASLSAVLAEVADRYGPRMAALLPRCVVLVDGVQAAGDPAVGDAAVVELLPPYAGG